MHLRRLVVGLTGLLVGGMVGIGAGLLGAPMPGTQARLAMLSEMQGWWHKMFPVQFRKHLRTQAAIRGMKQEINWKAGRLEWVRYDTQDEQRT